MSANMNLIPIKWDNLSFGQRKPDDRLTDAGKVALSVNDGIYKAEEKLGMETASKPISFFYGLNRQDASRYVKQRIENFAAKVDKLIYEDALTGLLNKRAYQRDRVKSFTQACKNQEPISVLTFDLDKFKSYNDEFGHKEGDTALQEYARVVKETLGKNGKAYRVGGEEFIGLVTGKSYRETLEIADNIRKELEEQTNALTGEGRLKRMLTVSIGVSTFVPKLEHKNAESLLKNSSSSEFRDLFEETFAKAEKLSDSAVYKAKDEGRNMVVGNNGRYTLVKKLSTAASEK